MELVEPLISEMRVEDDVWAAVIMDSTGQLVGPDDIDGPAWAQEMRAAAKAIAALDLGPRQLMVIHPEGYGRP